MSASVVKVGPAPGFIASSESSLIRNLGARVQRFLMIRKRLVTHILRSVCPRFRRACFRDGIPISQLLGTVYV